MNTIKDNFNVFVREYIVPPYVVVSGVAMETAKQCREGHDWLNRKVETLVADNLPIDVGNMVMAVWAVLPEIIAVASVWLSDQNAILVSASSAGALWSLYMGTSLTPIFNWVISKNSTAEGLINAADQVKPDVIRKLQKLCQAIAVCATGAAIVTVGSPIVGCGYFPLAMFQSTIYSMVALGCSSYQLAGPKTDPSPSIDM